MALLVKSTRDGNLYFRQHCPGCGEKWYGKKESILYTCDVCNTEYKIVNNGDDSPESGRLTPADFAEKRRWDEEEATKAHNYLLQRAAAARPTVRCPWCGGQRFTDVRFCCHCRLDAVGCPADQGASSFNNGS